MRLPYVNSQNQQAEPREQVRALLRQLLQCGGPQEVAELLARLDELIPWAQSADLRLAHYLERRSYQKALAHLDGSGGHTH